MKVVLFCGGLGAAAPRPHRAGAQADGADRLPADPVAHHEVLRPPRAPRLHPVPRLQGRRRQAVLPRLQRGAVQRLRARRQRRQQGRQQGRAAGRSDIHDWRITFADTGLHANIGQRLVAVRRYVEGEDVFLANYGDVLTDAPCPSWSRTSCAGTRWPRSWPSSRPTPSTSLPATTAWWSGSTTCACPTSGSTAAT